MKKQVLLIVGLLVASSAAFGAGNSSCETQATSKVKKDGLCDSNTQQSCAVDSAQSHDQDKTGAHEGQSTKK